AGAARRPVAPDRPHRPTRRAGDLPHARARLAARDLPAAPIARGVATRRRARAVAAGPRPRRRVRRLPPVRSGRPVTDPGARMDRLYRHQRHVYDLTRRFSLLGRDRMLAQVRPGPGERVCESGCGTARNLIRLAGRYPGAGLYGVDASGQMLASARAALRRAGLEERVRLVRGLAEALDRRAMFGLEEPFDRVVFSYSLSMVGPWREAVDRALAALRPGGTLHLVDFGAAEELPPVLRRAMGLWLAPGGVPRRAELPAPFEALAALGRGEGRCRRLLGGYASLVAFRTAGAARAARSPPAGATGDSSPATTTTRQPNQLEGAG